MQAASRWNPMPPVYGQHDPHRVPERIANAMLLCIEGQRPWPLVLLGPAGCGKTAAALCALDLYGSRRILRADQLAGRLRDARCGEPGDEYRLWRDIEAAAIVVLDDVGSRDRVSDSAYDAVKLMLDHRHGRPLIITSNLSAKRLAEVYDQRVVSRLLAGSGPDLWSLPDVRRQGGGA